MEVETEHLQPVAVDVHDGEHEKEEVVQEEPYGIAKGRSRRIVKSNPRYGHSIVAYAF